MTVKGALSMVMGCYKGMVVAPAHACEDATNNGTHNWSKKKMCVVCEKLV